MKFTLIVGDEKRVMELKGEKTIKKALDELGIPSETVVVKRNGDIVIEEEIINEGDIIEVIKVIYGG